MNLGDLRDRHKGRMAFVCGSGPSLRFFTDAISRRIMDAGGIVFTTNSAMKQCFDPTYHVICDPVCAYLRSFVDWANNVRLGILASHTASGEVKAVLENRRRQALSKILGFPFGVESLQPNASKVWQRNTATVTAMHLAIIAGCTTVVLVGCDCSWENGKKYFYQFPYMSGCGPTADDPFIREFAELPHPETGKPPRYIRPNRGIEGVGGPEVQEQREGNAVTGILGAQIDEWNDVARRLPEGVLVVSASIGTHMRAFPIVGLDPMVRKLCGSKVRFVDIDGTLTGCPHGPWGDLIPGHVEQLKKHRVAGDRLYAWSAQGRSYVRHFVEYHKINNLFDGVVDKPDMCYDDVPTIRPNLQVIDLKGAV